MALHEQSVGATDEWYTPRRVFDALGCTFDLDVCAAKHGDKIPARQHFPDSSLIRCWKGFVWMNPPFGGRNGIVPWLEKFFKHNNGIALVPDRTSAPWFQTFAPRAHLLLFVSPKLQFIDADGNPGKSPAQGTCLMALGSQGQTALRRAARNGLGFIAIPHEA
jgi:hypothetical protein